MFSSQLPLKHKLCNNGLHAGGTSKWHYHGWWGWSFNPWDIPCCNRQNCMKSISALISFLSILMVWDYIYYSCIYDCWICYWMIGLVNWDFLFYFSLRTFCFLIWVYRNDTLIEWFKWVFGDMAYFCHVVCALYIS